MIAGIDDPFMPWPDGHVWPGGEQYLPAWIVEKTSRDIDADTVIWDFFRHHAKSGAD